RWARNRWSWVCPSGWKGRSGARRYGAWNASHGPSGNPPGWKFISWMRASARARPRKRLGRKDAPHATAIFTTRRPRSSSSAGSTARAAPRERRNEAAPPHPPEPHLGGERGVRADFGNPLLPRLGHPRVRNARGP